MPTAERIKMCILIDEMQKHKEKASKLGLVDRSKILSEPSKQNIGRVYSMK